MEWPNKSDREAFEIAGLLIQATVKVSYKRDKLLVKETSYLYRETAQ